MKTYKEFISEAKKLKANKKAKTIKLNKELHLKISEHVGFYEDDPITAYVEFMIQSETGKNFERIYKENKSDIYANLNKYLTKRPIGVLYFGLPDKIKRVEKISGYESFVAIKIPGAYGGSILYYAFYDKDLGLPESDIRNIVQSNYSGGVQRKKQYS